MLKPAAFSTGKKVTGGFAAALVVVFVIGIVSFKEILDFSRNSELVSHTYQVIDRLTAINGGLRESESEQRGYLLAGNAKFLAQMNAARRQVSGDLLSLKELVSDDPPQVRNARVLESLIGQRLQRMDTTVAVRDSVNVGAAARRIDSPEAAHITDGIRAQVEEMLGVEHQRLAQRNHLLDVNSFRVRVVITLGSLFAFLVVALSGLMIYADLYERERAEAGMLEARDAAEKANHAKSDFLARMSHELRTPLNSVIGFANVLLKNKRGNLGEQDIQYLRRIQANGKHLSGVINDILDLSKIEAGHVELHRQSVDLTQLIAETVVDLEPRAEEKNLRLQTNIPPDIAHVVTDPGRLKQVLINLVANAIKFTESGSVTVRVVTNGKGNSATSIEVTDTGRGVREDRREAIFGAFEQEDVTMTREHDGTGLGLAISRALCQSLGYSLELNTELGRGSTFRIVFTPAAPLGSSAILQGNVAPDESKGADIIRDGGNGIGKYHTDALRNRTVLVIDDEHDARILLREMLEEFHVRVLEARSGEEGIRMACEHEPDLITLDLKMPGLDGWEVVRRLQAEPRACDIPVVIVSIAGGASQRTLPGPVAFLDKPASREETIDAIARHIHQSARYVLVVDDDADARELLRLMVESHGVRVRTANSGRAALTELDRRTPSLVILDIGMDNIDGLELLSVMRSDPRFETLPVVVVTGKDLTAGEEEVLRRSTMVVLRKNGQMDASLHRILETSLRY